MISRLQIATRVWVCAALFLAQQAEALVYCVTNSVDYHQNAPTGEWADSGWNETAPITNFLGTVIYSNAMLTAKHIWEISVGEQFMYEGQNHTVNSRVEDTNSDFVILFFTPSATNFARINIETNDISAFVVLQGRGTERGIEVVTGTGHTNGWKWGPSQAIRRWGVNRYIGAYAGDETYAVAAFDNNGDPDECMLSVGDSGGPGFIRTGSGWKLATVNYSVEPSDFSLFANHGQPFNATLYDYGGLYYKENGTWLYQPPGATNTPGLMVNTRTSKCIDWITNTVTGITFPADIGVAWRCETNQPTGHQAAEGVWLEVIVTNAGPYTARDLALDITWPSGVRLLSSLASQGAFVTNRWSLASLEDGCAATLRVDTAVWRAAAGWGTNRVSVTASDKPDGVSSNNAASCAMLLPATATLLIMH
ncbi:MAG: DUF11 domain-containing protein [bacterium]